MSYSKRQLVLAAFTEIGLASHAYDLSPDEMQDAVGRLDNMVADWSGKGIFIGYPIVGSPAYNDLDMPSNIPSYAVRAVITGLAIEIAPSEGRQPMRGTITAAKAGYDTLVQKAAHPTEMQFPQTMPRGAGNKPWRNSENNYFPTPSDSQTDPLSDIFLNQ